VTHSDAHDDEIPKENREREFEKEIAQPSVLFMTWNSRETERKIGRGKKAAACSIVESVERKANWGGLWLIGRIGLVSVESKVSLIKPIKPIKSQEWGRDHGRLIEG
jgi:hypothetical protein